MHDLHTECAETAVSQSSIQRSRKRQTQRHSCLRRVDDAVAPQAGSVLEISISRLKSATPIFIVYP
jgi:hypothetical protein